MTSHCQHWTYKRIYQESNSKKKERHLFFLFVSFSPMSLYLSFFLFFLKYIFSFFLIYYCLMFTFILSFLYTIIFFFHIFYSSHSFPNFYVLYFISNYFNTKFPADVLNLTWFECLGKKSWSCFLVIKLMWNFGWMLEPIIFSAECTIYFNQTFFIAMSGIIRSNHLFNSGRKLVHLSFSSIHNEVHSQIKKLLT